MIRNRKVAVAVLGTEKPQPIQAFRSSLREWQARYKAKRETQPVEQEKAISQTASA